MKGLGVVRTAVVAAAGAGLVLGAMRVPGVLDAAPARADSPGAASAAAPVAVANSETVCPGPERLGVDGVDQSGGQDVTVLASAAPAQLLPSAAQRQGEGTLTDAGLPSGSPSDGSWPSGHARGPVLTATASTPQSVLVSGSGSLAAGVVATQRSVVTGGDNRGLTTAPCGPAAAESWLVGGGGQAGRRERLVLTNPGPNPVSADVEVLGTNGPVVSPNGQGVVVAPYGRTVVLLNAISGTETSPVVHVTVQGGEVAAVLNDTWLDGVVARGGDDAVPSAPPAREQVVPGVALHGAGIVRVAVPGSAEAVVQTRVLTPTGPRAVPTDAVVRVGAGSTRDIAIGALPPDAYAVQVRADVPVVAGAMVSRDASQGPSDLAWSTATQPVTGLAGAALGSGSPAQGSHASLQLVAAGGPAQVTVTTVGTDGQVSSQQVQVGEDSVVSKAVDGAASVWVTPGSGQVRAAVVSSVSQPAGDLVSVMPLSDLTLTSIAPTLRELGD